MPSIALPPRAATTAARQHGVLSGAQLLSFGCSRRQIRYRVDRRLLIPFLGDTYRIAGAPLTTSARYMSATLTVPGSLLAGAAAAHLLGLPDSSKAPPEVVTHAGGGHRVHGVIVRRSWDLPERHRSRVEAIPVTTVPRTVLDLAAGLDSAALGSLVDELVNRRRITIKRLFDEFDHIARRGRPGTAALRMVLIPRLQGLVVPASELERRGVDFLEHHDFDTPLIQFRPPWAGRAVARIDVAYPDRMLLIEFDGRRWHDRDDCFESDRVRDQLAMAHGWIVVRITWRQLTTDPAATAARLRLIMAARTQGHSGQRMS